MCHPNALVSYVFNCRLRCVKLLQILMAVGLAFESQHCKCNTLCPPSTVLLLRIQTPSYMAEEEPGNVFALGGVTRLLTGCRVLWFREGSFFSKGSKRFASMQQYCFAWYLLHRSGEGKKNWWRRDITLGKGRHVRNCIPSGSWTRVPAGQN